MQTFTVHSYLKRINHITIMPESTVLGLRRGTLGIVRCQIATSQAAKPKYIVGHKKVQVLFVG